MTELRFVEKLRDVVAEVDVVLSDIWGVVHNGLESFPEACAALHAFRERGGTVILITNAPRPADLLRRRDRRALSRARRRGDLLRQAAPADLRARRRAGSRAARSADAVAARAGDRRFGAHRPRRRPWFRDQLSVRHPWHP